MNFIVFPVLCIVIAILFIYVESRKQYLLSVIMKGLASACFVVFGILGSKMCADAGFARLIVIGLILGAIADVMLNLRFVHPESGQKTFIIGIVIFLAGHVMYFAALIPFAKHLIIAIAAGIVLAAVTLWMIFRSFEVKKAFKIFGTVYCLAIYVMVCTSVDAYISGACPHLLIMMIGAVFFLASDLVLIVNTFGPEFKQSRRVTNLMLYYIGQLLIGLGLQFFR